MKITHSEFAPNLHRYRGFLFYGYDGALQKGVIDEVRNEVNAVTAEDFVHDPSAFFSASLFEAPKPLIIEEVSDKDIALYKEWLECAPCPLILMSTTLKTTSPLLKEIVSAKDCAAVPCYEGSLTDSRRILQRYLNLYSIQMEPEAFSLCASLTQEGQWFPVIQTLRLCSFTLSADDLIQLLPEARSLRYSLLTGDFHELYKALKDLGQGGTSSDSIAVVRLWQTQLVQLWPLAVALQKGISMETALDSLTPKLFFKYVPFVSKHKNLWTPNFLKKAFCLLHEAELGAKSSFPKAAVQKLLEICALMPVAR